MRRVVGFVLVAASLACGGGELIPGPASTPVAPVAPTPVAKSERTTLRFEATAVSFVLPAGWTAAPVDGQKATFRGSPTCDGECGEVAVFPWPTAFEASPDDPFTAPVADQKAAYDQLQSVYGARALVPFVPSNVPPWGYLDVALETSGLHYVEGVGGSLRGVWYYSSEAQDTVFVPKLDARLGNPDRHVVVAARLGLDRLYPTDLARYTATFNDATVKAGMAYLASPDRTPALQKAEADFATILASLAIDGP